MQTKFRAFQLNSPGSLFSYYKDNVYTLIEARLPAEGINGLVTDSSVYGKDKIDVLHITHWDEDHCKYEDLIQILNHLRPYYVQIPSYVPIDRHQRLCYDTIVGYYDIHQKYTPNVIKFDRATISGLNSASAWDTQNVAYHSLYNVDNTNDMSQIRLFRSAGFSVLSLGDCESEDITKYLMTRHSFLDNEVDILILPHHGSKNSMLNGAFLDYCKPKLAVCSSNYDNKFDHPHESVRQLLASRNIRLMTTKRGDIIVSKEDNDTICTARNLVHNNEYEELPFRFRDKKSERTTIYL